MNKCDLKRRIYETDFAIHELSLYLDTHPTCKRAAELLDEYRKKRKELIKLYERNFGSFIVTSKDVETSGCWKWLEGPWPWENNFMEG